MASDEAGLRRFLIDRVAERCRITPTEVDPERPLGELGLASRDAVAIAGELEEMLGFGLPATLVYEHPTISALARALAGGAPSNTPEAVSGADAGFAGEPVAVVGLGCRFPGEVDGPRRFWEFLLDRGEAVREVPDGRWDPFGDGSPEVADLVARTTKLGGFLDDIAGFDARFFGITPGEADIMDPQQRMLLEVAWEAFEHAGLAPRRLRGSRTGVFVGISSSEYFALTAADLTEIEPWTATGAALSIAANRLSYLLDLRGPSMIVDTACSSSLVATDLAVRSLRDGTSDVAVAAGVNVLLSPMITMTFDMGGGTAPDGRCKAFDAAADGMVRGEGCGVVVLKRLRDARRDGDRVLAVIRASAVNSDGRSNGLVAPNPEAQADLLRAAYAGIEPPDYVEAHGTGTLLGDPIEAGALGRVLRREAAPLLIGSVKSNLGHLESAAGVAGLIKTVLALEHRRIPASLHYKTPNPHIDFDGLGLRVVADETPWPDVDTPRAGVSGFGFGGTNAHIVLEAPPPEPAAAAVDRPVHTLLLSDVAADRIAEYAGDLADWLGRTDEPLPSVQRTLARRFGRGRFGAAIVGRDKTALIEGLAALGTGPSVVGTADGVAGRPVWVFSGYGAQRPGMGAALLSEEPAFASAVDEIDAVFTAEAGFSLWDVLESGEPVCGIYRTMTTLFGLQMALAGLWRSRGVEPAAVIGHSMGEIAAAVVAGALTLEDGVRVIVHRSRLLAELAAEVALVGDTGTMLVLGCAADEALTLAPAEDVHVAVRSSARQCVLTGDTEELARIAAAAEERGLLARLVQTEGAGHSPKVEPMLPALRERLAGISPRPPRIPFYTTVLDDPRAVPAFDGEYWAWNTRRTVRLADAVAAAGEDGHRAFVELNAHPLLAGALAETLGEDAVVVPTLRRPRKGEEADDTVAFHRALAHLQVSGAAPVAPDRGPLADVPPPRWRHVHHWPEPRRAPRADRHPLLGAHVELPGTDRHAWRADVADTPYATVVHGIRLLPPAAYAELALAAAASVDIAGVHRLRVERLLPLDERTVITTTLDVDTGLVEISAQNAAGSWSRLATASVGAVDAHPMGDKRTRIEGADQGSRYFTVHPLVLDRCVKALAPDAEVWVPAAIGSLCVLGPTHRGGTCETSGRDFRLLDDDGAVVLEATDVITRPVSRAQVPAPLGAKLVETVWLPDDLPADSGGDGTENVVVDIPDRLDDEQVMLAIAGHVRVLTRREGAVPRLWLVTDRAFFRALVRVLGFEHPALRATYLDTDDPGMVAKELAAQRPDTEIMWRDGVRSTARLRSVRVPEGRPRKIVRRGAAYVISGGYGGLGLVTARLLAERGAGRIVLSGRSGPSPEAEKIISELRESGAEIDVVLGDIAAPGVAERMVAAAREGGLKLAGVVHAAGGLADRLVADIGADDLHQVWAPKVIGARRLHEATQDLDLDWWVAYSSAAALLGSPGQGSYAAANAAVDALIEARRAGGRTGTTINWGTWSEVGGAVGSAVRVLDPISPMEGAEALEVLLAHDRAATGVLRFDQEQALALFPEIGRMPYFAALLTEAGVRTADDWPGAAVLRAAAPADALSMISKRVAERVAAVLGFAPDPGRPLTEFGLDSLVAIRIKSALEHDFGLTVPASVLLKGGSVNVIVEWAAAEFGVTGALAAAQDGAGRRDAIKIVDEGAATEIVRPLAAGGDVPLFLAHPAGGTTGVYRQLAGLLGGGRQVYGLERFADAPGVEDRAARYAGLIKERWPHGPYRLGGWSFGGVLAYEIARRLGADEVELVALIDAGVPKPADDPARATARRYAGFAEYLTNTYGLPVELTYGELADLGEDEQLSLVVERVRPLMELLPPAILEHQLTSHVDTRSLERYRLEPYAGPVILYRSTEPTPWTVHDERYELDGTNGFGMACPHLEIVPVPGTHHFNLLDPPGVHVIADHLSARLGPPSRR